MIKFIRDLRQRRRGGIFDQDWRGNYKIRSSKS